MLQLNAIENLVLTMATYQSRSLGQWEGTLVHGYEKTKLLTTLVTAPVWTVTATRNASALGKQRASAWKKKPHA